MSTGTKRPHGQAFQDAQDFRDLLTGGFERWTIAGSVRRMKPYVGDVEHVVVPAFSERPVGLFGGEVEHVNILWDKLDRLVEAGTVEKAVYGRSKGDHANVPPLSDEDRDGMTPEQVAYWEKYDREPLAQEGKALHRWGDKYRGVLFRGFKHEIFTADARNYGAILAIRTGSADFSQRLVTAMKQGGRFRQQDGYVRYANGASAGQVRSCPTEEEFFSLCGIGYRAPEARE